MNDWQTTLALSVSFTAAAYVAGAVARTYYERKLRKPYTICVDFDGVIHSYTSPWVAPHVIPDGPVPGALSWILDRLNGGFDVVILTTRARTWRGRRAIDQWLREHGGEGWYHEAMGFRGLEDCKVTDRKPAALIYIDDRGHRFDGTWPTSDDVHRKPWNKLIPEVTL